MAAKTRRIVRLTTRIGNRVIAPKGRAFPLSLSDTLQKVDRIHRSMEADQAEIDRLGKSTRENLAKTKAILDTF